MAYGRTSSNLTKDARRERAAEPNHSMRLRVHFSGSREQSPDLP